MPTGIYKRKPLSEETKNKISLSEKGKFVSEDTKKKISLALIGKKQPNKKPYSDEIKEKIKETARRMGSKPPSRIGTHLTIEQKKHLSEFHRGEKNYSWKGGKRSVSIFIRNCFKYRS